MSTTLPKTYLVFLRLMFITCLVLYNFQDVLLPSGSPICQTAVAIIMITGLLYLFVFFRKVQRPIFRQAFFLMAFSAIALLWSDQYVYTGTGILVPSLNQLLVVSYNFLLLFVGYGFCRMRIFQQKHYVWMLFILLIQAVISYYSTKNYIMLERDSINYTFNIGYEFVVLLPFVYFIKDKRLQLGVVLLITMYVELCAKRGAIVCCALFLIYYFFATFRPSKNILVNTMIVLFCLSLISVIVIYLYNGNEYLQMRLAETEEGRSSGRNVMYSEMWNAYWEYDGFFKYLCGNGLLSSVKVCGKLAHHDWLEILLSMGIIGISIYLSFFVGIFRFVRSRRLSTIGRNIVVSITVIWFAKTFFSMALYDVMLAPLPFLLGGVIGLNEFDSI